jgi:hypothetical protein
LDEVRVRFLALSLCLLLGACSTGGMENLDASDPDPPDHAKALIFLRNVVIWAKLQEPVEMSAPIRAPVNSSVRWIICVRSAATEASKRLTYSVFFKNSEFKDYRLSAIMEGCDGQSYGPMK